MNTADILIDEAPPPLTGSAREMTPAPPVTHIVPPTGWQWINFGELWQFRELLLILAWRDVTVRYKQTALGAIWAVLQPALTMVVFTVVFGRMANLPTGGVPYPIFVYAGLLPWSLFAAGITRGGGSVVASQSLITKIYFPRLAVPLASMGVPIVDFFIALGLLAILMLYYGIAPRAGLLAVPLLLALLIIGALGAGIVLAALNVYYRDFNHLIPYLVQLGMFATPTIYMQPRPTSGAWANALVVLNPIAGLVSAFRAAVLGSPIPWGSVGVAAVESIVVLVAACLYFRKVEDGFADVI